MILKILYIYIYYYSSLPMLLYIWIKISSLSLLLCIMLILLILHIHWIFTWHICLLLKCVVRAILYIIWWIKHIRLSFSIFIKVLSRLYQVVLLLLEWEIISLIRRGFLLMILKNLLFIINFSLINYIFIVLLLLI